MCMPTNFGKCLIDGKVEEKKKKTVKKVENKKKKVIYQTKVEFE